MRKLTTVLFLLAALLATMAPAYSAVPIFNGDNISATTPMYNASYYTSFQAAVTAAAGNGCVYVGKGVTNLGSTPITADNTFCMYCPSAESIIEGTGSPLFSIVYNDSVAAHVAPRIYNCRIIPLASVTAFLIQNQSGLQQEGLTILSGLHIDGRNITTAAPAVELIDVYPFSISGLLIAGGQQTTTIGLDILSSIGSVTGSALTGWGTCISAGQHNTDGDTEVQIVGNHTTSCGTALALASTIESGITANAFDNNSVACLTDTGSVNQITGNTFVLSAASNAGDTCIQIGNTGPEIFSHNNVSVNNGGNLLGSYATSASPVVGELTLDYNTFTYGGTETCGFTFGQGMGRGSQATGNVFNNGAGFSTAAICYNATAMSAANGYVPALIERNNIGDPNGPNYPPGSAACPTLATATWEWNDLPYAITEFVSGGTVSEIDRAGPNNAGATGTTVVTGLTSGAINLEPGDAIKITYSVAPTVACIAR